MARRRGIRTDGIQIDWDPDLYQVEQDVLHLAENIDKSALVLASAKRIIQEDIRERFDITKESPEGDIWEEWGDEYAKYAENHNLNGILVQESDLRDAAISDGPFLISGDFLLYDTGMLPEYAAAHQFGMSTGGAYKGKLPARPFLGVSPHAEAEIAGVFTGFIDGAVTLFYNSSGRAQIQTRGAGGRFGPRPTF